MLLKGELVIKNRGGYTATVQLTYTFNGKTQTISRKITGLGGSSTFQYERPATNVTVTVGAIAYSKSIFTDQIKTSPQCYDVYGTLPFPKYTPMNC